MKHLTLIFSTLFAISMFAQEAETLLMEGNTFYESGEYNNALVSYENAMNEASGFNLYFNAGNAAFKIGSLGKAILYYERAKKIDPTAEDVNTNLQIANSKIVDHIESLPSLGVEDLWGVVTAQSKLNTWAWLAVLFNLIGLILLSFRLFLSNLITKRTLLIGGIGLFAIGLCFYGLSRAANYRLERSTEAVVIASSVAVRNAPSENSQEAFVLHEGTKIKIISNEGDWQEIKIANGSVGWVKSDVSEPI